MNLNHASVITAFIFLFFGSVTGPELSAGELPSLPTELKPFMGDPDRGPEPDAKHARTRIYPKLDPIQLSTGNPFADYGHFRMSKKVFANKNNPLRLDLKDQEKASADRWQVYTWKDGKSLHYSLANPLEDATAPEGGFPLVVLQPGIGGIGKTKTGGSVWITPSHQKLFPSYVAFMHPAARTHDYMTRPDGINSITPTEMIRHYGECIQDLIAKLPKVNPKRIYLVGHSMGGSSTWQLMLRHPQIFAAAAPMAGVPPIDMEEAQRIAHMPIWMIIGNDDPWSGSYPYIRTYQNLVKAGAKQVRLWEVQDVGHSGSGLNMWPVADWLFKHSL